MKNKEYKQIEISIPKEISQNEIEKIKLLENQFDTQDFYFQIDENNFIIFLSELNFFDFKEKVEQIFSQNSVHFVLLPQILETIENIKSYGIKSKKRVYVGYNQERKVKERKAKIQNRNSFTENIFDKTNVELPQVFENQIVCAESKEFLKNLPPNCIDLILTSPPYNFGLNYSENNDTSQWEKYFETLFSIFDECIRVLKFGGRIIVNVQPLYSDYIPSHHIIGNYFLNKKLLWKTEILWEKNNYNAKYCSWGSWKSPSNPYLKGTWEFLEVFCKGTMKKEGLKENIDITEEEFKKWVNVEWSIAPERNMKNFGHPAMFPEELAKRAIKLFSYQKDVILDPFNGAGTTTCVAKMLNRKFLGIDISEQYCETALKRLENKIF